MPSVTHEAPIELIRQHPDLAVELLQAMSDVDLPAEIARLQAAGVATGEVSEQRWGSLSTITLPSGASLGLYQPKHPLAFAR